MNSDAKPDRRRCRGNRTESQVELFDSDASTKACRRSHNTAAFKRPSSSLFAEQVVLERGTVNKCASKVEFKSEGEKEQWCSTTQLDAPGVWYDKTKLPVRTGSKVTLGREKNDYVTSAEGAYGSNASLVPAPCAGRTAWTRNHSQVPLGGKWKSAGATSALAHTDLLPMLPPGVSFMRGKGGPTGISGPWADKRAITEQPAGADPNTLAPEVEDFSYFRRNTGATDAFGQVLRGAVNKTASDVHLKDTWKGAGFVSHNADHLTAPGREALRTGPREHVRTRSNWAPGNSKPEFGTMYGDVHNGTLGKDTVANRFSWVRNKSDVKLNSGEKALPAPHYASTHVRMQNSEGRRVLRGDVNKCASVIPL